MGSRVSTGRGLKPTATAAAETGIATEAWVEAEQGVKRKNAGTSRAYIVRKFKEYFCLY